MILVIAEKPSVAQSIAKVLGATSRKDGYMEGGNYIVSWCFGHLVELADASSYDERYAKWRYDDLPIVPENWMFEVTKDKAQQFKVLSSLMKDKRVTELVCATDAGREGELIFRLVYDKAGCTKPFKRLWISSLEDSAIREGFRHLRDGKDYDRLYKLCQEHGLLSPIYAHCRRNGCWFCPNASDSELLHMITKHPDMFDRLIEWENEDNIFHRRMTRRETPSEVKARLLSKSQTGFSSPRSKYEMEV